MPHQKSEGGSFTSSQSIGEEGGGGGGGGAVYEAITDKRRESITQPARRWSFRNSVVIYLKAVCEGMSNFSPRPSMAVTFWELSNREESLERGHLYNLKKFLKGCLKTPAK